MLICLEIYLMFEVLRRETAHCRHGCVYCDPSCVQPHVSEENVG